jgi:CheY-like chemotaxis protein
MPRILVVDGQADVRVMISKLLRVNHFELTEAANADSALRAFESTTFDGVIVDVFLGDAAGSI